MTVKNGLVMGGAIAGAIGLIALLVTAFIAPALIAIGWWLGWWSFEASVIWMLLIIAYLSGGGGAE